MPFDALVVALCLIPLSLWVTLQDLKDFTIPNMAVLLIVGLGIIANIQFSPDMFLFNAVAGLVVLALFGTIGAVLFRVKGVDALGFGDAKLIAACSLLCGVAALPTLLLIASLGGIVVGLIQLKLGRASGVAFGPYIVFANFLVWLTGPIHF
ncbi:prepilin peptidase [Octadecabacter ascidiaceicola]|uniref:prepilin peptidase n=1 Tax=Octadecabacter ascidiaceicola TaxID=1655543 RepID=UPI0015C63B09|nr:A24 family peptidase [Octadecabacter ascidiaceicola]